MAGLLPPLRTKFTDANGVPLVGGKLYSYAAGTVTPLATYTDFTELGVNTNPIILDANGEANIWITAEPYKFVLKDSTDVTLFTRDNVSTIPSLSITTGKIADSAVTTIKIADLSITEGKIVSGAVTTAKIADNAVTTVKILDSNVTTAKIADANVTTAKIADANVTQAKMFPKVPQVSSSCGSFTTSSTTAVDVTNLSVTLTTLGGPVFLCLVSDPASAFSGVELFGTSSIGCSGKLAYVRTHAGTPTTVATIYLNQEISSLPLTYSVSHNAVTGAGTAASIVVSTSSISYSTISQYSPGAFVSIDVPAAGTYTYTVQLTASTRVGGAGNIFATDVKLMAFEL